eukprot:scaffold7016_cov72-Skeletonema_dohrnii-CCMP3373.AAC.1
MAPIISSFTLPPPIYKTASTNSKSIIHSYFPQHDECIDNNDDVPNNNSPNPQLYRQNYNQLGVASAAPNDRQRMIMMNQNSGDDDEWEGYLDLNIDGEGEVMMENGVDGGKSDLPTRRKEEDLIDAPSLEYSSGGERRKASNSVDRRNSIDVNANPRNEMGDKSPRRSDIKTAQLRSDTDTIKGESLSVDKRKEVSHRTGRINGAVVANEIERQEDPPSNNVIPMSATKSSPDANDFRQQFMSRKNINAKAANNDDSSEQTATTSPPSTSSTTKRKRVTTEEIEFIKSTIPLTDVIETYNLDGFTRTNTHSAKACCPFHDDNNPSMSIDDNRGLYKCFACGAGGDVFNFI